jgi:hypothetical protein
MCACFSLVVSKQVKCDESTIAREGFVRIDVGILLLPVLFAPLIAFGQSPASTNSQSASIVAQETAVLCPQGSITDVLLTGTASWTMGSDSETGQITLKARATGQSRVDLVLGTVSRSEIRINDPLTPQFETLAGGQWTTRAVHNGWVDANWFFPALSALVVGPQNGFALGSISDVSHVFSQFQIANQKPAITSQIQGLSTVLYDLDPSTRLPVGVHFSAHPDENLLANIPVDVQYSDYRVVNGLQVPFRIQRYFNGTLQLDITISAVTINPGLTNSDFAEN